MSWFLAFVGFAVLIILHELGHFAAAKAVGMRVERFALFFPPKLFTIPAGVKVSSMRVVFRGQGRDVNGNPVTLESNAFTYGFDELQ